MNSLPLSSRGTSERKRKSARVESSMRLRPLRRSLTSKSRRTIQTNSVSLRSGFSLAVVSEHVRFLEDIPPYLYGPLISCLSPVVVDGGDGPAGTLAQVWRHESVTKSRAPVDGTTSLLSISLSVYGYFLSEVWPGRGKERERERESAGHLGALKKPTRPWPVRQGRINYASEPAPLTPPPVSKKIQTRWNAIRYGEMSGLDALTLDLASSAPQRTSRTCSLLQRDVIRDD